MVDPRQTLPVRAVTVSRHKEGMGAGNFVASLASLGLVQGASSNIWGGAEGKQVTYTVYTLFYLRLNSYPLNSSSTTSNDLHGLNV